MDESTEENGLLIIWKDLDFTHGKMDELLKVSTLKIRNMVMGFTFGQMDENTWEIGLMGSNMD